MHFKYDALGRRIWKKISKTVTKWLWDGNKVLHEWKEFDFRESNADDLITWVFEEDSFAPVAKIKGEKRYSLICDHIGTPIQGYNESGEKIWERELDSYGKTRIETGDEGFTYFTYQGQVYDKDIDLTYNRMRWYDQSEGIYASSDPIGLEGGNPTLYAYVSDTNTEIDPFGLKKYVVYQAQELDKNGKPTGKIYTGRASGADNMTTKQILDKRKSSHHRKLGPMQSIYETDDYKAIRGAEHHYINEQRKKGNAADQINGIADRNFGRNGNKKKGDVYMEAFENERKKNKGCGE